MSPSSYNMRPIEESLPDIILQFGECKSYISPSGEKLTLLPGCDVPLEHLIEDNWDERYCSFVGRTRGVKSISQLVDGEKVSYFRKMPEREFTADAKLLKEKNIWWGGITSLKKSVLVSGSVVEDQVYLEAAYLLKLVDFDYDTEKPLAIMEWKNSRRALIVKGIDADPIESTKHSFRKEYEYHPDDDELIELYDAVKFETGMIPWDCGHHNTLIDYSGKRYIIDVNRWDWPGYSEPYRQKIYDAIIAKIAEKE